MKSHCMVLMAVLVFALAGFAQERPAPVAPANSVYVGADGRYEAAPDTAVMQFNISAQEDTSQKAYARAAEAADQIRRLLRSNGIDPKSAEIGFFSLEPVYDYRTPKRKLVGYRVNSSVSLKLKDFSKIAPIVQQLSDLDVTSNQTLHYTLDDMEAAKSRAVEDAVRKARETALTVARASGRQLGELSNASVDVFPPAIPMPRVAMGRAMKTEAAPAPTAEFTPQEITVTAHVNALFLLK